MDKPAEPAGGARRFDLVREAVMAMAQQQLREGDRLRVITFASLAVPRFDRDVTAANLGDLREILRDIRPAGGTWINNALHRAWDRTGRPAADRVVLVLSDLQTERFDEARWAERLCASGVHLAVVAVGQDDPQAPLKRLADASGGRFELRGDLTGVSELFIELVDQARRTPLIRRADHVRPTGPIFGLQPVVLPAIDARLAATAQGDSRVLAVVEEDAPLLASRSVGAGRAVHLAAPLEAPHNRAWRTAADAREVLAGAVAWVRAPAGDPRYVGRLRRDGPRVSVEVTAEEEGRPINHLNLAAWTTDVDGLVHEAACQQVAPGRYEAVLAVPTDTAALVHVGPREAAQVLWTGTLAGGYGREFAASGVDADALDACAAITRGAVVSAADVAARLQALDDARRTPLGPWVLALALIAALADWFTTRATSPPAADSGGPGAARAPSTPPTKP